MTKEKNGKEISVALGTNLGSDRGGRRRTLAAALVALAGAGFRLKRVSRFFSTPCFPADSGPDYVNACVVLDGPSDPPGIMKLLHEIEAAFGRDRQERWGSRTLDLDLLSVGDIIYPGTAAEKHWRSLPAEKQIGTVPPELILPHPRIADRSFVLVPLADVAPGWIHPATGQSVRQMLAALPEAERGTAVPI
jgi:2-amino-4-hydroxy-6-hydroxymethyldihydropteridine diphosphokinase